jgi:hypothetical protein
MKSSDWIALAALVVSLATASLTWWERWASRRRADVTAFLHWLPAKAAVAVGGSTVSVGYHLVLWNRGPARAADVSVEIQQFGSGTGQAVELTDAQEGELPLSGLEPGARYPIPWALGRDGLQFAHERRFEAVLTWSDSRRRTLHIPLRRGNVGPLT